MDRIPRLSSRKLIAFDGLAAIAYLVLFAPTAVGDAGLPTRVSVPLMVVIGMPLALRRVWPAPVFMAVLAASVGALILGVLADPFVAASFALYPVGLAAGRSRLSINLTGGIAIVILVVGSVAGTPYGASPRLRTAVLGVGFLAGAWTAGQAVRARRAESARAAAELADRAVAEERLRIARELHDVVAHSMSIIAVQAGTANHVMAVRPTEAQEALRAIESTSRTALTEMRQLLGVLRSGARGVEFAPLPGPSGLPTLVRRAEEAGVRVRLDLRGTETLPGGMALSIYRIVQEALTNVVRHAAPTSCEISVTVEAGEVRIEVTDDGRQVGPRADDRRASPSADNQRASPGADNRRASPGADNQHAGPSADNRCASPSADHQNASPSPNNQRASPSADDRAQARMSPGGRVGHGLIGMRERVLMYGGSFQAGPRPEGGFAVSARLPCAS
ncbi:histidine kinase [Actinoplanes sp. KI2]|uniref:sensor histidine kinase n=1 Tax=Actinoplanes sp. KI2 TaxID=2983315 RepID=UPI0021D58028|nr:histidine kinase [Actinoplanes sp. KI2]MCU7729219.1 histidine kinase [Actinoplanes sp. KI2]